MKQGDPKEVRSWILHLALNNGDFNEFKSFSGIYRILFFNLLIKKLYSPFIENFKAIKEEKNTCDLMTLI